MAGLLDEFTDGISETLSTGWDSFTDFAGGLLEVSPEYREQKAIDDEALKQLRLNDGMGNDWMYNQVQSTNPNKFERFFENIPYNAANMYLGGSDAVRVPQDEIKPIANLAAGGVLNLAGGLLDETIGTEQREMATQFASMVKDNFKDWESISNMIANNPLDAMAIFASGGFTAAKVAQLAKNPAITTPVRNMLQSMPDPADVLGNAPLVGQFFPNTKIPIITYQGNNQGAIFTKMDMKKVGTNSGTKVQGHGLYVGENKDTGKRFARHDTDMMTEAKKLADIDTNTPLESQIWLELANGHYPDTIRKELMKDMSIAKNPKKLAEANVILRQVEERFDTADSQLYEIDLSDDAVATMIRRELPLTGQPENVQKLMRENYMDDTATGKDFYESLTEQFAEELGGFGAERAASQYLSDNGIPGMKFLDDLGNSAAKVAGKPDPQASNYVLYNTDTTKILKRQDIDIAQNTGDRIGISSSIGASIDDRFAGRKRDKDRINRGVMDVETEFITGNNILLPDTDIRNFEGYPFVSSMSDTSSADGTIIKVNGTDIVVDGQGVRRTGGQDHMLIPENVDRGILWASAEDAVGKIVSSAGEAKRLYKKDPLFLPFAMSPTGMDFSHPITQTMLNSAIKGLDADQIAKLDELILTTSKESVKDTNGKFYIRNVNQKWKGTLSKDPLKGTTGGERKEIARIIDVNFRSSKGEKGTPDYEIGGQLVKRQQNGVISYPTARLANADPLQLDKGQSTLQNVGLLNLEDTKSDRTPLTKSYDTALKGVPVGRLPEAQRNISILDLFDNEKADGSPMTAANMTPDDMRKLTMQSPPIGLLTHKRLMALEKRGLLD